MPYKEVEKEEFWNRINSSEENHHSCDYIGKGETIFSIVEGRKEIGRIHSLYKNGLEVTRYMLVESIKE